MRVASGQLRVSAGRDRSYALEVSGFETAEAWLAPPDQAPLLVVSTPTVARLYGQRLLRVLSSRRIRLLTLPLCEAAKTMETALRVCAEASEMALPRDGIVVGFGGGVCTDVAGVAASLYRRGVSHIRVPTTLLGQIDAAIGIKSGLNFRGKNDLGSFHPPAHVVVDPQLLRTLPRREISSGLAEIVKIAVVRDARLFEAVEAHWPQFLAQDGALGPAVYDIVRGSIAALVAELEPNLYEDRGYARLADFGHSFSPALEAECQFRIRHGEAVAVDMALSTMIALDAGLIGQSATDRIVGLLTDVGLPIWHPALTPELCQNALCHSARQRAGTLNLVVPAAVGEGRFIRTIGEVGPDRIVRALDRLRQRSEAPKPVLTVAV